MARIGAVDQQATFDLDWRKGSERSCEWSASRHLGLLPVIGPNGDVGDYLREVSELTHDSLARQHGSSLYPDSLTEQH
jgi:hypothetical protein